LAQQLGGNIAFDIWRNGEQPPLPQHHRLQRLRSYLVRRINRSSILHNSTDSGRMSLDTPDDTMSLTGCSISPRVKMLDHSGFGIAARLKVRSKPQFSCTHRSSRYVVPTGPGVFSGVRKGLRHGKSLLAAVIVWGRPRKSNENFRSHGSEWPERLSTTTKRFSDLSRVLTASLQIHSTSVYLGSFEDLK
jgi:hypothetical protein